MFMFFNKINHSLAVYYLGNHSRGQQMLLSHNMHDIVTNIRSFGSSACKHNGRLSNNRL